MLSLILPLLWFVTLVGFVWLVIRASKTSVGWGLGVFFLSPIAATIYAIKHWEQAKQPFTVYIISGTTASVIIVYTIFTIMMSGAGALVKTSMQPANGEQQKRLTDRQSVMIEAVLKLLEKFVRSDEDQQTIAVVRQYLKFKRTGLTDEEQQQLARQLDVILEQQDLDDGRRQSLENIREAIGPEPVIIITAMPASSPPQQAATAHADANATPENPQVAAAQTEQAAAPSQKTEVDKKENVAAPSKQKQEAVAPKTVTKPTIQKSNGSEAVVLLTNTPKEDEPITAYPVAESVENSSPFKIVLPTEAMNYVGKMVILIGKNGVEHEFRLIGATRNTLHVERHLTSGSISYSYDISDIESLKVHRQ